MIRACQCILSGQALALLALLLTTRSNSWLGLQVACGVEAVGFGLGAAWVAHGAFAQGTAQVRALWLALCGVCWMLAVRHGGLTVDPLGDGAWLRSVPLWTAAIVAWVAGVLAVHRWGAATEPEPLRPAWPWWAAVIVLGAVNTAGMAQRRVALRTVAVVLSVQVDGGDHPGLVGAGRKHDP